jgi:4-hydroxyphenylpyruvate dioxygenase
MTEAVSMVKDPMAIKRIDHVRMFVGNARQSAYFYRNAFGFDVIAYAGLETGVRHEASYVLRQGEITFVLCSPLHGDHPDALRLVRHGDGVQSIALEVDDVAAAFEAAVSRGAEPGSRPRTLEDEHGSFDIAEIKAYGDTTHTLVNRTHYRGIFAPGYQALDPDRYGPRQAHPVGLRVIDHIVANVEEGKMGEWVEYYNKVMGFSLLASFDDKEINEPARGQRRSQIEEFLDFHDGPGVQHIALATPDIVSSVRAMAANDVSFLKVPPAYYDLLSERVGTIKEDIGELAELGILVDRDDEGYLLQIFTKPVEDRPTLFFEIIQRRGARSFGKGNFKALFEAIELEQARRGTL